VSLSAGPAATDNRQVAVAEALADGGGPGEGRAARLGVALENRLDRRGEKQIALLHTVAPALVEQPACAREPAAAPRGLAVQQQPDRELHGAAGCPLLVSGGEKGLMRARPEVRALRVAAGQPGRGGQSLEVGRAQRCLPIGGGQPRVSVHPCLRREGGSPTGDRVGHLLKAERPRAHA
jgi:hypothetical protein